LGWSGSCLTKGINVFNKLKRVSLFVVLTIPWYKRLFYQPTIIRIGVSPLGFPKTKTFPCMWVYIKKGWDLDRNK
jgi:hypothetical protein